LSKEWICSPEHYQVTMIRQISTSVAARTNDGKKLQ
jgi:hypothetical protein